MRVLPGWPNISPIARFVNIGIFQQLMKWLFSPYQGAGVRPAGTETFSARSPSLPLRKICQSWLISRRMLRLRTGELHRGVLGFPPIFIQPLHDHVEHRCLKGVGSLSKEAMKLCWKEIRVTRAYRRAYFSHNWRRMVRLTRILKLMAYENKLKI